jgi:hypothetical protein
MIKKEQLTAVGAEKLADILLSLYENHKDIKKELDIVFAGLDGNPKKLVSMIKKEITALKKSTRFVDYYGADDLANRLDQIREGIVTDLKQKSVNQAIICLQDFLDLHEKTLNRVDDSNGSVGDVFRTACEDLGPLYAESPHTNDEVVAFVYQCHMNNGYGVYDGIIHHLKTALGDQGLKDLKERIKTALNNKNRITVKRGLADIADAQKDVEAYIEACQFTDKLSFHDHLEVAKRLIEHWRGEEALKWLETAESSTPQHWEQDKTKLKIQALELCGAYEQAQAERIGLFEQFLSPETYGHILKHCKEEEKSAFKAQAIEKAFAYPYKNTALSFLMKIQEIEEAARFVRLHSESLSGRSYETLRSTVSVLKEIDPIAATLLSRQLIKPVLEKAVSKYYVYAVKDLLMCESLAEKILDWEGEKDHKTYFEELSVQNKRKVSFWQTYEAQIKKNLAKRAKEKGMA